MTDLMTKLETVEGEQTFNVEAFGGCHIDRACQQATKVATVLGVVVQFDFNGVACYARPESDWRTLKQRWGEIFHTPEDKRPRHAMAWSDIPD